MRPKSNIPPLGKNSRLPSSFCLKRDLRGVDTGISSFRACEVQDPVIIDSKRAAQGAQSKSMYKLKFEDDSD